MAPRGPSRRLARLSDHLHPPHAPAATPAAVAAAEADSVGGHPTPTELSREERAAFVSDGYIILRDAVPKRLTEAARRAVNIEGGRKGVRAGYK